MRRRETHRSLAAALALLVVAGCSPAGCEDRTRRPAGRGPQSVAPAVVAARKAPAAAAAQRPAEPPARPGELSGRVARVRDGDSLVVLADRAEVEIRLDSVDAPELAQVFGAAAKRCASGLAFGRTVRLEAKGRDQYGRTLAEVYLPDGRSLNRELVSAGCAWWFRRHSDDRDLERRETQARDARRGLWADRNPVPPWEFRAANPRSPGVGRPGPR